MVPTNYPPVSGALTWCRALSDRIGGPYETYAGNGIVIGPNATAPTATRWGDLSSCAACHDPSVQPPPVYCAVPPCQFDNSITGGAICSGPYALPAAAGKPPLYASFVGLNHDLAWASSMRGPWTIGTAASTGQLLARERMRESVGEGITRSEGNGARGRVVLL